MPPTTNTINIRAFSAETLPQNLRDLQAQLNSAIRAHRNLVGRVNLCPEDRSLLARVRAAERLIARIHREQKPLLERFRRDCRALTSRSAEAHRNGDRFAAKMAATVDELLEERVRCRFCPTTLEKWGSSIACLSPDKKRKINFLACFDLITPKLRDDVTVAKSSPRRRRQLVNPDFPLVSSAAAAAAAAAASMTDAVAKSGGPLSAPASASHRNGLVGCSGGGASNSGVGILTRSSRRARHSEDKPAVQQQQQQQQQQQSPLQRQKPQFCCARCHCLMPAKPRPTVGAAAGDCWCQACSAAAVGLANGTVAIGLPASPLTSASGSSGNSSKRSSLSDEPLKRGSHANFRLSRPAPSMLFAGLAQKVRIRLEQAQQQQQ